MDKNRQILLTKIIATLGPVSGDTETIKSLIRSGARAFRINFSHGDPNEWVEMLENVRKASEATSVHVAVIGDISGPKIRIGKVSGAGILLKEGEHIFFQEEDVIADSDHLRFSTNYPGFITEVETGQRLLMDDGSIVVKCIEKGTRSDGNYLKCEVSVGGMISSHKGVNLPDTDLAVASLTEKDHACVDFAVKRGFDALALSFVRTADDIKVLKEKLADLGARPRSPVYKGAGEKNDMTNREGQFEGFIPIIAKIEKPQAIRHLEEILRETDMVMVARGDLGVEMDITEVAVHQKHIVSMSREYGVPVIVATQMLQSMISDPSPTRAEVSDVANAILDGADAVMLSGETAIGKWPVGAVSMMNRIAIRTNQYIKEQSIGFSPPLKVRELRTRTGALAHGVKIISAELRAKAIGVWTELGGSAVFFSQQRMALPILAFSHNPKTLRLMSLLYGLQPIAMKEPPGGLDFVTSAMEEIRKLGVAEKGEAIVFAYRIPFDQVGVTNEISIHYVD